MHWKLTCFSPGILSFILNNFWSWTTIILAEQRKYFLLSIYKKPANQNKYMGIVLLQEYL